MARKYTMSAKALAQRRNAAAGRGNRRQHRAAKIAAVATAGTALGIGGFLGYHKLREHRLSSIYQIPQAHRKEFGKLARRIKPRHAYEVLRHTYQW